QELERFPRGTRQMFPERVCIEHVAGMIKARHAAVAPLFCTGIGHRLMFIEATILVEVLLRLIDTGITALPIHDAVIVAKASAGTARDIMRDVFREHIGGGVVEAAIEEE